MKYYHENKESINRKLPEEKYTVYKHVSDLVNETLCPKKDGSEYHAHNALNEIAKIVELMDLGYQIKRRI